LYTKKGMTLKHFWDNAHYYQSKKNLNIVLINQFIHLFIGLQKLFIGNRIIHHDIKPVNIIIVDGDGDDQIEKPKYIDFGLMNSFDAFFEQQQPSGRYKYWPDEIYYDRISARDVKYLINEQVKHITDNEIQFRYDPKKLNEFIRIMTKPPREVDPDIAAAFAQMRAQALSIPYVPPEVVPPETKQKRLDLMIRMNTDILTEAFKNLPVPTLINSSTGEDNHGKVHKPERYFTGKGASSEMKYPASYVTEKESEFSHLLARAAGEDYLSKIDVFGLGVTMQDIIEENIKRNANINLDQSVLKEFELIVTSTTNIDPKDRPSPFDIVTRLQKLLLELTDGGPSYKYSESLGGGRRGGRGGRGGGRGASTRRAVAGAGAAGKTTTTNANTNTKTKTKTTTNTTKLAKEKEEKAKEKAVSASVASAASTKKTKSDRPKKAAPPTTPKPSRASASGR